MKKLQQKSNKTLRTEQYKSTFLNPTEFLARDGKTVYISEEFHQRIGKIIFMLGGGKMTLSDYLQNLLQNHFEDFEDEITKLYTSQNKSIF
jgi:hypothetical protein